MPDRFSKNTRSAMMSNIRSVGTAPELAVRALLKADGYHYRLNKKQLPGRPDIVVSGQQLVIFVHGCFWHMHKKCKKGVLPKSNTAFWKDKLQANADRDVRHRAALSEAGWKTLVIWECELGFPAKVLAKLRRNLASCCHEECK